MNAVFGIRRTMVLAWAVFGHDPPVITAHLRRTRVLVLSRKVGESIQIGDNIAVMVLEVRGGRVRLGFNGPPAVTIHRQEVFSKIEEALSGRAVANCG